MMMTRSGRRGKKSVGAFFFPSARCGNSLPRLKTPFLETTVVATMELSFAILAASSSIGGWGGGDGREISMQCSSEECWYCCTSQKYS